MAVPFSWLFDNNSADPACLLLTLAHPSFGVLRLAQAGFDVTSRGQVFTMAGFEAELVNDDGEVPRGQLTIPIVSGEILDMALGVDSPVEATLEVVRLSAPDVAVYRAGGLQVRAIKIDDPLTVSAELSGVDIASEPMGFIRVVEGRFPAIFRGRG